MVWVPVEMIVGVYVALQLAELAVGLPSVQGEPVNVPVPLLVNETVPVGALVVPPDVSVTVTLQVVGALTATGVVQVTVVRVVRSVTVTEPLPELDP